MEHIRSAVRKAKKKVAFLGRKTSGANCLRYLLSRSDVDVVLVVTVPKGYEGWWGEDEVYEIATRNGIDVVGEDEQDKILEYDIDLIISVLYPRKVHKRVLDHAKLGGINLHAGPLPHYRGTHLYSHAILNGERKYGAALHYMDADFDTGPIIEIKWFDLRPDITAGELRECTEKAWYDLLVKHLSNILNGSVIAIPQEQIIKTEGIKPHYYHKISLSNRQVDLRWEPQKIYDFVRALQFGPSEVESRAYIKLDAYKFYLSIK